MSAYTSPQHPAPSRRDEDSEQRATSLGRVVLCIDDDEDYLTIVRRMLGVPGIEAIGAASAEEALEIIARRRVDAIVTDLNLPRQTGIDLVVALRAAGNNIPVLVLTGEGSVHAAVEALKQGAADFLQKPIDGERLRHLVQELLNNDHPLAGAKQDEKQIAEDGWFEGMLGRSPAMRSVFDAIVRVAHTDAPVLIVGESGSGKELVARAIHARSNRRHGAFVPVHTGAIPKELVASELFGHERGAFTGAITSADGKFEAAQRGSIFLDEVGTMVHDVQIALLRVLETMRFTPVGARKEHIADSRIIAATNRDLLTLVQENRFREDLYFRLNVFSVVLPPLRERREDIIPLAEHYLVRFARRYNTPVRRIPPPTAERLLAYPWPGNIRELRNVMERAAVFATSAELLPQTLQLVAERLPSGAQVVRDARAAVANQAAAHDQIAPPAVPVPVAIPGSVNASGMPSSVMPASGVMPIEGIPQSSPAHPNTPSPLPPPHTVHAHVPPPAPAPEPVQNPNSIIITLGTTIEEAEKSLILRTLEFVGGNKQKAARVLGISRRCLYNRLEEYGVMKSSADAHAAVGSDDPTDVEADA